MRHTCKKKIAGTLTFFEVIILFSFEIRNIAYRFAQSKAVV